MPFGTQFSEMSNFPLRGQKVLVTRPNDSDCRLSSLIEASGGEVVKYPVIELTLPNNVTALDESLRGIGSGEWQWLVFVSASGVRFFLERANAIGVFLSPGSELKVATIGRSTAKFWEEVSHIRANLVPETSNSESLANALIQSDPIGRILIVRADRGSDELARKLADANLEFKEVVAYQSRDIEAADPVIVQRIESGGIDWITFSSSAIAKAAIGLFGDSIKKAKSKLRLASISPATSKVMSELGFAPDCEAEEYNFDSMVKAMTTLCSND